MDGPCERALSRTGGFSSALHLSAKFKFLACSIRAFLSPQKAELFQTDAEQLLCRLFTGHAFFLQGLILALCYTASQDQRGAKASFFFFTVPAQLVPYCMILFSVLVNPGMLPLQISGLVSAHLHDFLTRVYPEFGGGPNFLPTPAFLSRLVQTPRVLRRDYGTAIRNQGNQGSVNSTGASTGSVLPDSWRTRGTGQRLGGD